MAQPASLLLFASAILSAVLAAAAGTAPRRQTPAVRFLFLVNVAIALWSFTYFVQLAWGHYADPALAPAGSPDYLLLLVLVTGICLSATYWFLLSASMSPRASWWTRRPGVFVAHVPFAYTLVVAALNPFGHLFIRPARIGADAGPLLIPHYVTIVALVAAGVALMLSPGVPRMSRMEKRQRIVIAGAACLPLLGSLVWIARRTVGVPVPFNPTPALFAVVGLVVGYEVLFRGFGNLVPLATLSSIVENAETHLAYLGADFRFVAANETFRRRSRRTDAELLGRPYFDVMPDSGRRDLFERARFTREPVSRADDRDVFPRAEDAAPSLWRWTLTPVLHDGDLEGFVLSLADVTDEANERELARTLAELDVRIQRGFASDTAMWEVVQQAGLALASDVTLVTAHRERGWRVRDSRVPRALEPWDPAAYPHLADVLTRGRTLVVEDALTDERFGRGVLQSLAIRSALIVPLCVDGDAVGAMSFQRSLTRDGFTTVQVDFAERFADSVALTLQNSRRYEDERLVAQTLQESMLHVSVELPGVEYAHTYRSASEAARVGGDFYDLFQTDDGRIAMLIGDVAGHGLEAAVLTSLIKNAVRSAAIERRSPARIMSSVNEVMWRQTEPGMFATAFLGLLDPADGTLTYCSAGHPPCVLVGRDGSVAELPQHSTVLGLGSESSFSDARAQIDREQLMLLYTDGLTEARSGREFFGTERLSVVLAGLAGMHADEVVRALFDNVAAFSGERFADDVAVVAVRLIEAPGAGAAADSREACSG